MDFFRGEDYKPRDDASDEFPKWPQDFFEHDSRGFRCVRRLGEGGFGSAWLIKHEVDGRLVKNFVAKYAISQKDDDTIENEMQMAKKLYGAMHIAQPVVQGGQILELDSFPEHEKALKPILMMELVPGITVQEFWYRINGNPNRWWPVPNRILWMMFRCLIRGVFAMANPPDKPFGEEQEEPSLEPMPAHNPGKDDYQIQHGDLNSNNIMFGGLDTGEHRLVPILKIIDFGLAKDSETYSFSSRSPTQNNIFGVGKAIQAFWDPHSGNLDDDFRELITECVSLEPDARPALDRLWGTIQNAVNIKTGPSFFPGKNRAQWETNDIIRQYMQTLVLDADAVTPVAVWGI